MQKWIYHFSAKKTDGNASMKDLLGGKGANLAFMCSLGMNVPPGFTITTELNKYYLSHKKLPENFESELKNSIEEIEQLTGKIFGNIENPLLFSIRSGSKYSMPGMMDTILNLGMNDRVAEGIARETNNPRFAYDSYRRFIQMYSDIVLKISHYEFEEILDEYKFSKNYTYDNEFETQDLKYLVSLYKDKILHISGKAFPSNVYEQLNESILAVLNSWMNPRAIAYRNLNNIDHKLGTAVSIQSMVFGNYGQTSGTGVVFTRNPSTGENILYGEYLINAQGEDVVAGIRTPDPIKDGKNSLESVMPEVFKELQTICKNLENHFKDMQDIEFTIEEGKLWILQTRNGKRSAESAIKIAVDLTAENLISEEESLLRIDPYILDQLLHPMIDSNYKGEILATGLPASPGAATGIIVLSPLEAEELASTHKVILVRNDTSPEDIKGMHLAKGILTVKGGMTSHAAVVARGMGRPCVSGAGSIYIDEKERVIKIKDQIIKAGEEITIDGSTGKIYRGSVPMIVPNFSKEWDIIMNLADKYKRLKIRANAEVEQDAKMAIKFGAVGIGLCRTEHMFFEHNKIHLFRKMIVAINHDQKIEAIEQLLPLQIEDFKKLFKIMRELPITIRLLDPPLHEFLPHFPKEMEELAVDLNMLPSVLHQRVESLKELNPMLGHRGCRLGISQPEIYEMQVRAIFSAASIVQKEQDIKLDVEIMVPLISSPRELSILKDLIERIAAEIIREENLILKYSIGTMIELPRAALKAEEIAKYSDFFSFGTNDLTQTIYGISRDDISSFLNDYKANEIFKDDPFVVIDEEGVGEIMKMAMERGKKTNPNLKFGVCGEHGGNPESIDFCHRIGLDYVSCSPYRVPIARLAAAQSAIRNKKDS